MSLIREIHTNWESVSNNNPFPTKNWEIGVPWTYTKITENSVRTTLQKWQLNKINLYPKICNEHCESSREIQWTVTNTNIVGQVFKASKDNITALWLTLESAAWVLVDNFEAYTSSANLQASWVATGNLALLETTTVKGWTKSMALPWDVNWNEWVKTMPATSFLNYTWSFDAYFTKEFNKFKVSVFIWDGTNTKSFQLAFANKNEWNHFNILESSMVEDWAWTTNVLAITQIWFRIDDPDGLEYAYIDNLVATPPPWQVEIKLWNMWATIPTSWTTTIDSWTQYTKINWNQASYLLDLKWGKRLYSIHQFEAWNEKAVPTNELLVPWNYYVLELKYVDTNIDVYWPNTSFLTNYYNNGYAFTAPSEAGVMTQIGTYSDIMFHIFSTQPCYILEAEWRFDAAPNWDSDISVFIEDTWMIITDMIVDHEESPSQESEENISARPMFIEDGGKLEMYYNDDFTDWVSTVTLEMRILFEPSNSNW